MNKRKACFLAGVTVAMICLWGCGNNDNAKSDTKEERIITLAGDTAKIAGESVGTSEKQAVYLSNDIIYYEDKDSYESGNPYGEGTSADKHTEAEASEHTVVNITDAGTYRLKGNLDKGQIRVDLGEDAKQDEEAVVTLILDGVDIKCEVAPAILFLNVYECDYAWDPEEAQPEIDTEGAGANLVIADGSTNQIEGAYVAKIFKDKEDEKKLWKQDGAIYSYVSMNVNGEEEGTGVLNLTAANEGLDTELHLTINGGNINIFSQNDGINTNEDGVSVTTINGGNIHIVAGLGAEGDGIDSNGWLVINGGTVVSSANPASDAGLDSDMGSYVNGGTVIALGSTMDWAESDSDQVTMNLQFADYKNSGDAIVVTKTEDGSVVFAYDPSNDEVLGSNVRKYMGAIVSCGEFKTGDAYQVFIGGTISGTETGGVYDASSVTAYADGIQQKYTGTDVGRGPGGFGGGMPGGGRQQMPEGERPEMLEGEMPQMPEGERPELPEGEMPQIPEGERPELPEGEMPQMPEGEMPEGELPEEFGVNGAAGTDFYMQDKVNSFSGVADV